MNQLVSESIEFIEGFVDECFKRGFTEKQASEMLDTAIRLELFKSSDPDFHKGFQQATKAANFATDPSTGPMEGVLKGMGLAGLGSLLIPALTRGRVRPGQLFGQGARFAGRGGDAARQATLTRRFNNAHRKDIGLVNFMRNANPFKRVVKPGSRFNIQPGAPFRAIGKGLGNITPLQLQAMGGTLAAGGLTGLGVGLTNMARGTAGFADHAARRWLPYYAGGPQPSLSDGGGAGRGGGGVDLFTAPSTLKDYYSRTASGVAAGAGAMLGGSMSSADSPLAFIRAGQSQLKEFDRRIEQLNSEIQRAGADPSGMLQAANARRELGRLNRERNRVVNQLQDSAVSLHSDQTKFHEAAALDHARAGRLADYNQGVANFHAGNVAAGEMDSWDDVPRSILGWLLNSEEKARGAASQHSKMRDIQQGAQRAQAMRWTP